MTARVAFLRGIDVGGHNRIGMQRLRELLTGMGCEDARTHLQSGNAAFRAPHPSERTRAHLEERIAQELGLDVRVLTNAFLERRLGVSATGPELDHGRRGGGAGRRGRGVAGAAGSPARRPGDAEFGRLRTP